MNEAQVLRKAKKTITQIAEIMEKSERSIYYYLSEPARPRKKRGFSSKLDPFKDTIKNILELKENYNYNRVLLYEDLEKLGYTGKISILRDYTAELTKKEAVKAYYRFETIPGYQAQVDWKECGMRMVNGKSRKVYAFVMTLGYSRKPFIIHTLGMNQSILLACHILAFEYFGGIPEEILYDNMKTAFVHHHEKGWQPNKQLLRFANHYGFVPKRCRVRRPQTKGKVERTIGYYSSNFLPRIKEKNLSIEEMNELVLDWIDKISKNPIRELKESRNERFEKEKEHLKPLPADDFVCDDIIPVKVYGNSVFHYETNKYSVPCEYIGMNLILMVNPWGKNAKVYHDEKLIRHVELSEKGAYNEIYRPEDKAELIKLCEKQQNKELKRRRGKIQKKTDAQVETRDPGAYEKFTDGDEAA